MWLVYGETNWSYIFHVELNCTVSVSEEGQVLRMLVDEAVWPTHGWGWSPHSLVQWHVYNWPILCNISTQLILWHLGSLSVLWHVHITVLWWTIPVRAEQETHSYLCFSLTDRQSYEEIVSYTSSVLRVKAHAAQSHAFVTKLFTTVYEKKSYFVRFHNEGIIWSNVHKILRHTPKSFKIRTSL